MAAFVVVLGQDIEKEGLHIIVEGLVVQEQLGQQTQVLTVDCAHISIDLLKNWWKNNNQFNTPSFLFLKWQVPETLQREALCAYGAAQEQMVKKLGRV